MDLSKEVIIEKLLEYFEKSGIKEYGKKELEDMDLGKLKEIYEDMVGKISGLKDKLSF